MIRRTLILIPAIAGAAAGCATGRAIPDPAMYPAPWIADSLTTRPERTDFRETSSYDDVVAYMRRAAALSPLIHLTTFGRTNEGRDLPLAVVGRVADASPEAVRASGKTVVYLQGNIHAGEVEGKEALQILLGDVPVGLKDEMFDSLVLLIAPIYNADGNERIDPQNRPRQHGPIGGMGVRPNAQGLDLNRDHTKLESPEARGLARMLTEYDPHVVIDLHTTNGTYHGYHLTYAPPLHPNTPPEIDRMLRREWLPAVTAGARQAGWLLYYYGNVPSADEGNPAAERGWYTFDHRPRFGTNYAGLRNRFGLLSEAYSYLTFQERVRVTQVFVDRSLDWARTHAAEIRRATEAADREDVRGRPLALNARLRREGPVTILMGEVREEANPVTGHMMLRRVDTVREERMPEFQSFDAAETERAPAMYLLPPGSDSIVDRLRMHGVRVVPVDARPARMEVFRIDSTGVAERAFQGHRERRIWGRWEASAATALAPGTLGVPMDQPLARLVFTLLEPRSDDGFAAWNLLDRWIEGERSYPIARVPASP